MSFHKVVKAPTKRAHIKNYPHKKSEWKQKRAAWLLEHAKTLATALMVTTGKHKLRHYTRLKEVEHELKTLKCYDGYALREVLLRAKHKHTKLRMGFF